MHVFNYCGSSETTCMWVLHIIMDIRVQYFANVDFCLSLVNFGRCGVSDNGILRDPEQVPTWFNYFEDVREKAHTTQSAYHARYGGQCSTACYCDTDQFGGNNNVFKSITRRFCPSKKVLQNVDDMHGTSTNKSFDIGTCIYIGGLVFLA